MSISYINLALVQYKVWKNADYYMAPNQITIRYPGRITLFSHIKHTSNNLLILEGHFMLGPIDWVAGGGKIK